MALTHELLFTDAQDMPSSGWMTALGIVFLFGTIFQELGGIGIGSITTLLHNVVELFSLYIVM